MKIRKKKIDIVGKKLKNPNIVTEKLMKRDPLLFLSKDEGKYKNYIRMCPSNFRRQPLVLNEDELLQSYPNYFNDNLSKEKKDEYRNDILPYSSPEAKQLNYYVCPRYWCLTEDRIITEEELNNGVCGGKDGIIPHEALTVPEGKQIYEFRGKKGVDSNRHWNPDGSYRKHFPGIMKEDAHPDGLCVPCCVNYKQLYDKGEYKAKNVIEEEQTNKRIRCDIKFPSNIGPHVGQDHGKASHIHYIRNRQNIPLLHNRLSYLPKVIQNFMKRDNSLCHSKLVPNTIKKKTQCILREGVENSSNQSFLGCIVKALNNNRIKTIKDLKKHIVKNITIDEFVKYHNGDLTKIFFDSYEKDIDQYNYENSLIYKKLNKTNKNILDKIIIAFENYKSYILDDKIEITYRYLWDLISSKNEYLFENGVNLIILKLTNEDITDEVEFICPTNNYSSVKYDMNKPYLFIIEENNYFEIICKYYDNGDGATYDVTINYLFDLNDKKLKSFKDVMKIIKDTNKKCNPKKIFTTYEFKKNIKLDQLEELLNKYKYEIEKQIINNFGKVIGVIIKGNNLYLPCYPTNIDEKYEVESYNLKDNSKYKLKYEDTKILLDKINKESNKEILSKPVIKIIENNIIVGILTETNQFVPVKPTKNIYKDDLMDLLGTNFIQSDYDTIMNDKNKEMELYTKKIKLETNFFNIFRNNIRLQLININNFKYRKEIDEIIKNYNISYLEKLDLIMKIIKTITNDNFKFLEYNNEMILNILDPNDCYNNKNCDELSYCYTSNNGCNIFLPKFNLINNNDNEYSYIVKISDELIRYEHIRTFLLDPNIFTSFVNINYNLYDNEIILLESLLQNYITKNLIDNKNNYIISNTYDDINPIDIEDYQQYYVIDVNNININDDDDLLTIKTDKRQNTKQNIDNIDNIDKNENKFLESNCFYNNQRVLNNFDSSFLIEKYPDLKDKKYTHFIENMKSIEIKTGSIENKPDKEIEGYLSLDDRIDCAFNLVRLLINDHINQMGEIKNVKNIIIDGYRKMGFNNLYNVLGDNYEKRRIFRNDILDKFNKEKNVKLKTQLTEAVKADNKTYGSNVSTLDKKVNDEYFDDLKDIILKSDKFYLGIIDLVIIGQELDLPLLLIYKDDNKETESLYQFNNKHSFYTGKKFNNYYYIIVISEIAESNYQSTFNLIVYNKDIKINGNILPDPMMDVIRNNIKNYIPYDKFEKIV